MLGTLLLSGGVKLEVEINLVGVVRFIWLVIHFVFFNIGIEATPFLLYRKSFGSIEIEFDNLVFAFWLLLQCLRWRFIINCCQRAFGTIILIARIRIQFKSVWWSTLVEDLNRVWAILLRRKRCLLKLMLLWLLDEWIIRFLMMNSDRRSLVVVSHWWLQFLWTNNLCDLLLVLI